MTTRRTEDKVATRIRARDGSHIRPTTTQRLACGPPADRRHSHALNWAAAMAALQALLVLAAGRGGSNGPAIGGWGSTEAQLLRYTRCIRNQGVSDFPDPPPSQAAPSGFKSIRACEARPQQPDVQDCHPDVPLIGTRREAATPPAGANITEELRWARCTRSHGVPSFPDPNRQRAFDSSSKFDPHLTRVSGRQHDLQIGAPTGRAAAVPGPGPSAP